MQDNDGDGIPDTNDLYGLSRTIRAQNNHVVKTIVKDINSGEIFNKNPGKTLENIILGKLVSHKLIPLGTVN